jgi:AraC family chemosensory pili system transcriptional regulator ChpD
MSPPWTWIVPAAVLLLVVAVVRLATVARRRRRQIDSLMIRLEELETRLAGGELESRRDPGAVGHSASGAERYSQDVLAGRSSYVAQLVSRASRPRDIAEQAVVSIYRAIEDPLRPSDLARELCVTLRTLQRGVGRTLGCTPNQLILTIKMREARRMLASGELRVGEVAHRLGFADTAHLTRRYRTFYRCPPSQHLGGDGDASSSGRA